MPSLPKEVELKLLVSPDCLDQLRGHPAFESLIRGEIAEQLLLSTYYDFDDLALRRNGLSLRVRQIGPRRVQTLKSAPADGAPCLNRMEIERPIEGDTPDLGFLDGSPLSALLASEDPRSLRPLFETKIRRKAFRIEHNDAEIEFALDTGDIVAPDLSTAPVSEIELELKRGEPGALFEIAKLISGIVPAALSLKSKSDIGYGLIEKRSPTVKVAEPVELTPDMMTADAFRLIARSCLRHLVVNHEPNLAHDPEAIHQTRVALRRLRVALSAFKTLVADERLPGIKDGLKRFARELGPARDLDVLIDEVLKPFRTRHPKDKGAASLVRSFHRRRLKAHEDAAANLQSSEFHAFIVDCAAWIEAGPWAAQADPGRTQLRQRPVALQAAEQIGKRRKQCRKFGKDLDSLSDTERHRVRIGVKKLRYSVEFFESLYRSGAKHKHMKKLLRACQRVQNSLGALNDTAVRRDMFAKLLAAKNAGAIERAFSAGMLLGEQEHEARALKKKAARAWKTIHTTKPFWKISATQPLMSNPGEGAPPPSQAAA